MIIATHPSSHQKKKKALSIVDYYPDENLSVYENDSCGFSLGCDLLAGFSGDESNRFLRIIFNYIFMGWPWYCSIKLNNEKPN